MYSPKHFRLGHFLVLVGDTALVACVNTWKKRSDKLIVLLDLISSQIQLMRLLCACARGLT